MHPIKKTFTYLLILLLAFCSDESVGPDEKLPLLTPNGPYLGFTPFPYDVTSDAVLYSYDKIQTDANIIAHHFDNGIPWQEALDGTDFHANVMDNWNFRKASTPGTHKKYVAVTPLNIERNGLATYKSDSDSQPLPAPWNTYTFNHTNVKTAYLNYCKRVIDFFDPDYLCIGIEVNLLINADESLQKWNEYVELHSFVYNQLKNEYQSLPIMVSVFAMDFLPEYSAANNTLQLNGLNQIMNYSDFYGISIYTYLSALLTDSVPSNLFDRVFPLVNKPICIAETGYPAQSFSINGGSIQFNSNEDKQYNYFDLVLRKSREYEVEFVIDFVIRDYDKLWEAIGSPDDFQKLWRDTGFYDENGNPRKVLELWKANL